jgi:uncharacterized protein
VDIGFIYQGQRFVWDAEKAAGNVSKHGVSFEKASEVFFDPFVLIEDASPANEERQAAIGLTEDWQMLFVVHLMHEEDAIRIVSARPATPHERSRYENERTN